MRLRLTLKTTSPNTCVPFYYTSGLGRTIESWFADLLPQCGNEFVYSRLFIKSRIVDTKASTIRLLSPTADLYLSTFLTPPSSVDLKEMLHGQRAGIGLNGEDLTVDTVKIFREPAWHHQVSFRMLSPTALPNGNGSWLKADDAGAGERMRSILIDRYTRITGDSNPSADDLSVTIDKNYVATRGGGNGVMKIVKLIAPSGAETEVQAFVCPVTLRGDPKLIALAYNSGMGVLGSQGFGMVGYGNENRRQPA